MLVYAIRCMLVYAIRCMLVYAIRCMLVYAIRWMLVYAIWCMLVYAIQCMLISWLNLKWRHVFFGEILVCRFLMCIMLMTFSPALMGKHG